MSPKGQLAIVGGFGAGLWFSFSALRKMREWAQVRHWPVIEGRVVESLLYQDPARKNATHFRVTYEFTVGERILGATPRLSGDWFWNNRQQAAFVARYPAGAKVEVFYDPRDPRRNCLDREDRSGIIILWIIAAAGTGLASLLVWLDRLK